MGESGEEYFCSVAEKTQAIRDTMERYQTVSQKQTAALKNMLLGIEAWFKDHDDDEIPF